MARVLRSRQSDPRKVFANGPVSAVRIKSSTGLLLGDGPERHADADGSPTAPLRLQIMRRS